MDGDKLNRSNPRVLLASNYNDGMALSNGLCFDSRNLIAKVSSADIVAPQQYRA